MPLRRRSPTSTVAAAPGFAAALASLIVESAVAAAAGAERGTVEARPVADGIELLEAGQVVLAYRDRAAGGAEPWRLHYVHPLRSRAGVALTEDAPADHVHQRGVFWAWRRVLLDGALAGDGWVGKGLGWELRPPRTAAAPGGARVLEVAARWIGTRDGAAVPLIDETARIRVDPVRRDGRRRIGFEIRLRALRPGVAIAGTDDDKGYGGFSVRFAHSPQLAFASAGRELRAAVGAVRTGDVVELRWRDAPQGWPEMVSLACRVEGRPWHAWVLRQEDSMQNCAFPGRVPHAVPVDRDLVIEATIELNERR